MLLTALIDKISALESRLTEQEEKEKMGWLKRKLTAMFEVSRVGNYDMNSPFGMFGIGGMI